MNLNNLNNPAGFTLMELIVVVAILAIMGIVAFIGVGGLGDSLAVEQAGRTVEDLVAELETEILVDRYENTKLYFEPDYLVAVSTPKGSEWNLLQWDKIRDTTICSGKERFIFNTQAGDLIIKNEDDEVLEIKAMPQASHECIEFNESEHLEWRIQLRNENGYSPVIRFIHFNLDPEKQGQVTLAPTEDSLLLELEGPYAHRTLYQSGDVLSEPVDIEIQSTENDALHTISIQP